MLIIYCIRYPLASVTEEMIPQRRKALGIKTEQEKGVFSKKQKPRRSGAFVVMEG